MLTQDFYSIRMRASRGHCHISGAERIVSSDDVAGTVRELLARASNANSAPEHIDVKIDALGELSFRFLTSLDVVTMHAPDKYRGQAAASRVLQDCGISRIAVEKAIYLLSTGAAASGGNMRGAIIMDAQNAERLEPDQERGIRASRFDWSKDTYASINLKLNNKGLNHFRTREALALATKVAHAPGMMAELCWSDDPEYTAGYVSSLKAGYVRFPVLKDTGVARGGRVFFVDRTELNMNALTHYLQAEPVLITETGRCNSEKEP